MALSPLAASCVIGFVVAYGCIAPHENLSAGHRALAERLGKMRARWLATPTVMFFNEIDEGLWFYARGSAWHRCPAVSRGTTPRLTWPIFISTSDATTRACSSSKPTVLPVTSRRFWTGWTVSGETADTPYVLMRGRHYDLFAAELAGRATAVLLARRVMKRNELVLLKVSPHAFEPCPPLSTGADPTDPRNRSASKSRILPIALSSPFVQIICFARSRRPAVLSP